MDVIVYFFAVVCLFLAFVRCFAMAIDMFRSVVCWNHVDGVAVWWVSSYESLDNSLHMAFTPCRRCCGELVRQLYPRWHLGGCRRLVSTVNAYAEVFQLISIFLLVPTPSFQTRAMSFSRG